MDEKIIGDDDVFYPKLISTALNDQLSIDITCFNFDPQLLCLP